MKTNATKKLKDYAFKILYHVMPGLPGSTFKSDVEMFKKLFEDSASNIAKKLNKVECIQIILLLSNEKIIECIELLLDNKKLNSLISVISNTIKDFENFTFNTKYDFNSNSMTEIIRKISGKDAIKIFIKSVQKILENNIRSGRALKKDSLESTIVDFLEFLFEDILQSRILRHKDMT